MGVARNGWMFSVEQCDVSNPDLLTEYRRMVGTWVEVLSGDPQNSVIAQIHDMMWHDAAWRALNEGRRLADKKNAPVSPLIASLLDRGYVTGQVIAIGRLLETGSKKPAKQINSLRRIVDEIAANQHLFTRELFIAHDGLPYDWELARKQLPLSEGVSWLPIGGPDAWTQSMLRHEEFDRLSGVSSKQRDRSDRISPEVIGRMEKVLSDPLFDDVLTFRHKSIAHAADAFSRATAVSLRTGLKLDEFARAHFLLLGLYQAINANLLYQDWLGSAVPIPQEDIFVGLDKPYAERADVWQLSHFWDRHCVEREDWLNEAYHQIIPRKSSE